MKSSKIKYTAVRLIFTGAVQDGEAHYSQVWSTYDIPIPNDVVNDPTFKNAMENATVAGVVVLQEYEDDVKDA